MALEANKEARCAAAVVQGMGKLPAVAAAPSCSDKLDRRSLPIVLLFDQIRSAESVSIGMQVM